MHRRNWAEPELGWHAVTEPSPRDRSGSRSSAQPSPGVVGALFNTIVASVREALG